MKPPKVPKGILKKPLPKAPPFNPRPARTQPAPPSNPAQKTAGKVDVPKTVPFKPQPLPYREPPKIESDEPTEEEIDAVRHTAKVNRWRSWALFGGGLVVFGMGVYSVQLWISLNRDPLEGELPRDLTDRFDKEAHGYDEKVNTSEMLMGLNSKRKALLEKAKGHVLEVAVGTGRNIQYYPTKKCDTVTLLDVSGPMLAVAKRKWKDEQPEYFHRVFFKQQSAIDPITPPYGAQDGYDTVIETMGLCSTPDPVLLLRNLEAATKEGGQILLLEHGKSHYQWLNNLLDKWAPAHAHEHGCWWNKDIGKIVEESGLEVVQIKRYNFGTTWWVELKPRKGMRTRLAELAGVKKVTGAPEEQSRVEPGAPVAQRTWWNFWK